MVAFVVILLCSNVIGAAKVTTLWGFTFGAGILFFPVSYLFGDVLTEVYGYAKSRKVIWAGFGALLFASFMSWFIVAIPPADGWDQQEMYDVVFSQTPRIALASFIAYWCGEFTNSFVMAKMKIITNGKKLWMRTIGSTFAGEAVDSIIFYPVAFWGIWPDELVIEIMIANYLLKTGWEVILTPVTYKIVKFLKKAENEDYYDINTNFSPFKIES